MNHTAASNEISLDRLDLMTKTIELVFSLKRNVSGAMSSVVGTFLLVFFLIFISPLLLTAYWVFRGINRKIDSRSLTTGNYARFRNLYDVLSEHEETVQRVDYLNNGKGFAKLFHWVMLPITRKMRETRIILRSQFEALETEVESELFTPVSGRQMWEERNKKYNYLL